MAQPEPCWYAVQIHARAEKKAVTQFQGKGVETFLPTVEEINRWSDRRKAVEVATLHGYALVRPVLMPQTRPKVLQSLESRHLSVSAAKCPRFLISRSKNSGC